MPRCRCTGAEGRRVAVDGVGGDGVEVGDGEVSGPGSNADGGARGGDAEAVAMLSGVLPGFDA
jgi:hypothetical protein